MMRIYTPESPRRKKSFSLLIGEYERTGMKVDVDGYLDLETT